MFYWLGWIIFIFAASFLYASWRAAPWVPLRKKDVERVIALAKPQKGEKFFDLGCGDGRVLEAAAISGAQAVGLEISLLPYFLALGRSFFYKGIKIVFKDFWLADLRSADIVYFFLMPEIFPRLKEKLEKELKPGARVVSYVWPLKDWQPEAVDNIPGRPKIYLYIKK